ncbi:hypothetical protein LTR10_022168 [Elasticomyces elasticus]|uniref:Uncharacterized protein n=1 Tax=Exophiala sideris TaxID=1016849 RepID=A0ABR0IVL8_9EURO|nr:hypothetical protein LTR10_022168 [Elasticomyces elasticus]KAK5021190.1 hypothetical protein LTS07_011186 [Exophiala sideris]KAK5023783.1 hypothetical protein LTR13_011092 [Exophiala sideris]KAK5048862.1 hypothetical protein LTR69_011207 [Exophiala sideris]KAK5176348.1 hypothetical protein LTR44_011110 [Eurotiomycetes sp. CCFEE 6388]
MAPPDFDHSRSYKSRYDDLQSLHGRGKLERYISDFVTWLKACPKTKKIEVRAEWETSVNIFLDLLLDNFEAWEIAKSVVPEFCEPKDYVIHNMNMEALLRRLRLRLPEHAFAKPVEREEREEAPLDHEDDSEEHEDLSSVQPAVAEESNKQGRALRIAQWRADRAARPTGWSWVAVPMPPQAKRDRPWCRATREALVSPPTSFQAHHVSWASRTWSVMRKGMDWVSNQLRPASRYASATWVNLTAKMQLGAMRTASSVDQVLKRVGWVTAGQYIGRGQHLHQRKLSGPMPRSTPAQIPPSHDRGESPRLVRFGWGLFDSDSEEEDISTAGFQEEELPPTDSLSAAKIRYDKAEWAWRLANMLYEALLRYRLLKKPVNQRLEKIWQDWYKRIGSEMQEQVRRDLPERKDKGKSAWRMELKQMLFKYNRSIHESIGTTGYDRSDIEEVIREFRKGNHGSTSFTDWLVYDWCSRRRRKLEN